MNSHIDVKHLLPAWEHFRNDVPSAAQTPDLYFPACQPSCECWGFVFTSTQMKAQSGPIFTSKRVMVSASFGLRPWRWQEIVA